MTESDTSPQDAAKRAAAAREEARRAAHLLARGSGAEIITRPTFPGAATTVQDVEPLAGARAALDVEIGARHIARRYIRQAREAGHSWEEIGQAMGLAPGADPDQSSLTVAEAAYTYAAGRPDTEAPWRPRTFVWSCQSCEQVISDGGLSNGPADDERGHAQGCSRLASAVAAWDADWEAEP